MKTSTATLERHFSPRWSWRTVGLAATVTVGLYLLLPSLERLSVPAEAPRRVQPLTTVRLPPPPPPLLRPPPRSSAPPDPVRLPAPVLTQPSARLEPLEPTLDLRMPLADTLARDLRLGFDRSALTFAGPVLDRVFEISDLDEPPRPRVRPQPIYPPQARMRGIEGSVTVEFVVQGDGTPRDIGVVSAHPGEVFVPAALRAIARWRFAPGRKDGAPVATRVRQTINFNLR